MSRRKASTVTLGASVTLDATDAVLVDVGEITFDFDFYVESQVGRGAALVYRRRRRRDRKSGNIEVSR